MLPASELRTRMAVRLEGALWRVIAAEYHGGGGKMGGVTHAKLRNLRSGAIREWRFRGDETVEEVQPQKRPMQFLYTDGAVSHFMNPESYEQIAIDNARLGRAVAWLKEEMTVGVEFVDDEAIGIVFPDIAEGRVAATAAPSRSQGTDNVWKEATLDNGVTVMVPPFIAEGEAIRVDVETGRYVERAKAKGR